MSKQLCILIFVTLLLSLSVKAQIQYEPGYFVTNDGNRTECFIRNIEWKNNPTKFQYKLSESSPQTAEIDSISEFAVSNQHYKRFAVKIDRSPKQINRLTNSRQPEYVEETVFLKFLVSGPANLFVFTDSEATQYYFQVGDSNVEHLVYKQYKVQPNKLMHNNLYQQQILTSLPCQDITLSSVEKLRYTSISLERIFIKYNHCANPDQETSSFVKKRGMPIYFTIRSGISQNNLDVVNSETQWKTHFKNFTSFRIGGEFEITLPFNKNKWSIIIEPTYTLLRDDSQLLIGSTPNFRDSHLDHTLIQIPFGIRHYFFLNDRSKIFLNGIMAYSYSLDSKIRFDSYSDLTIGNSFNLLIGAGYVFNSRYSAELRYSKQDILNYTYWSGDHTSLSVIIGYRLFTWAKKQD